MKGGHTPIHVQRWAPVDYHEDEHVRVLKARRDYVSLTFYRHFIDKAFVAGGSLPASIEMLSAAVEMRPSDVRKALEFCLGRLVFQEGDRLYQRRVRREVTAELRYRSEQVESGRRGGQARKRNKDEGWPKGTLPNYGSPPAPTPSSSSPSSSTAPVSALASDEAGGGDDLDGRPATLDETRCPDCEAVGTLRRSKDGESWFCGTRLGGCDGRFRLDHPRILTQLSARAQDAITRRSTRSRTAIEAGRDEAFERERKAHEVAMRERSARGLPPPDVALQQAREKARGRSNSGRPEPELDLVDEASRPPTPATPEEAREKALSVLGPPSDFDLLSFDDAPAEEAQPPPGDRDKA